MQETSKRLGGQNDFEARETDSFNGDCQEATGFLKITQRTAAATKHREQGSTGSEVPMLWSNIEVTPGTLKPAKAKGNFGKEAMQQIGIFFGAGGGLKEPLAMKRNRVCAKLLTVDDALVRAGVAKLRFTLYKLLIGISNQSFARPTRDI